MHEASIADSILKIASTRLRQTPHAEAVTEIHVLLGEFRNVEPESLQFAFDALKGMYTGLAECELFFEIVKTRAFCQKSKHQFTPEFSNQFRCDKCASGISEIICGEELEVYKICIMAESNKGKEACTSL